MRRDHASTPPQTVRSDAVRKTHRKQERPLPFELQVLPPVRKRIKRHAECGTRLNQYGVYVQYEGYPPWMYLGGVDLSHTPARWAIWVHGKVRGYHKDGQFALGYAMAARSMGLSAYVEDTSCSRG